MKKKCIFNETFMMNYWLFVCSKDEIEKQFPKWTFNGDAKCLYWLDTTDNRESIVIWIQGDNQVEFSTLEHEIFHAVMLTSRERGLEISDENDETGAYLFQWLHRNFKCLIK